MKLIKKTVFESIMVEMKARLESDVSDKAKRDELIKFTESRLTDILNTLSEEELLPKRRIASEQDFEKHILSIIQLTRDKLIREVKSEY